MAEPVVFGDDRLPPRFWDKAVVEPTGCWRWDASCNSKGYGLYSVGQGVLWLAHRAAFTALRGVIPEGLQIDHLCRNKRCVNPDHLEAVTAQVNVQRASAAPESIARVAARVEARTHCAQGHPLSGDNVRLVKDRKGNVSRQCRICLRAHNVKKRKLVQADPEKRAARNAYSRQYYKEHSA
jgi:hypothetical protein